MAAAHLDLHYLQKKDLNFFFANSVFNKLTLFLLAAAFFVCKQFGL